MNKLSRWVIGIYISLYIVISFVSTMHSVSFFGMTNDVWMARCLAGAFELGQLAAMAGLMTLERSSKKLIATLMITLTAMQIMANMYFSYAHVNDALAWFELFGLQNTDPIVAKRILAAVSGGLLPLIALGFSKSLVDYLKPEAVLEAESDISRAIREQDEWLKSNEANKDPLPFRKDYVFVTDNKPAGIETLQGNISKENADEYFKWRESLKEGKPEFKEVEPVEIIDEPFFVAAEPETTKPTAAVTPVRDNIVVRNGIPTGTSINNKPLLRDAELPDVY